MSKFPNNYGKEHYPSSHRIDTSFRIFYTKSNSLKDYKFDFSVEFYIFVN